MELIVDTDILIDVARGDASATSSLRAMQYTYWTAISSITEMELIVWCRNKAELAKLNEMLEFFEVMRLTSKISDLAAPSCASID